MKLLIIFLDYLRHDFTEQTKSANFANAGYPFDVFEVNMRGVSKALNEGLRHAEVNNYDAVVTMANDILMPNNWLALMVQYASMITNTGTVGIHCVESIGAVECINGLPINRWDVAFGNALIPMNVIKSVGYFNIDHDPYGMQDSDYAYRCTANGYMHYYIHGLQSEHIGHDVGNGTEYRAMKDEGLAKVEKKNIYWKEWYERNGYYLPYDQEEFLINKEQFFDESSN